VLVALAIPLNEKQTMNKNPNAMKLKLILALITGIIIGITVTQLLRDDKCSNEILSPVKTVVATDKIGQQLSTAKKEFDKETAALKVNALQLRKEANNSKTQLEKIKKKNLVLQTQVYDLLDQKGLNNTADTLQMLAVCDTLQSRVNELLETATIKDSLYENVTVNLEGQLANKDSTITVKDDAYQALKISLDQSLLQQKIVVDQNKNFQQLIKRQKTKSKLVSAGLLVLSGVAANYLIHH
jgi:hypothetical protein